jgi:putative oxidoreductase
MLANPFLYWMDKIYGFFIKIGSNLQSIFLLYMRLTWGHQFFLTGLEKLKSIPETIQLFTKLHIPSPTFHAYEVGIIEALGGILLIAGFASRIVSIPLIILTVTALSTAHAENLSGLSFITDPHILVIQRPYPFLITSILVFIFGPGRVSLDAWIKRWLSHQPKY